MTLKLLIATFALTFASHASFAAELNTEQIDTTEEAVTNERLFHGRLWQCSAHSTHDEWNIYEGYPSRSRHSAEHSAIQECESHEGHQCALHHCHQL